MSSGTSRGVVTRSSERLAGKDGGKRDQCGGHRRDRNAAMGRGVDNGSAARAHSLHAPFAGSGHLRWWSRSRQQPVQVGSSASAERRTLAAREHRRGIARFDARSRVSHPEDARMLAQQRAVAQAMANLGLCYTGSQQFTPGHHAMRTRRNPADDPLHRGGWLSHWDSEVPRRAGSPRGLGVFARLLELARGREPLARLDLLLGPDDVHHRVDQRKVRERLREIPKMAAGARIDLLGVQAER